MPTACPAKTVAEIDLFPTETDAAAMGDHDGSVVERVVNIRQPVVRASGGRVDIGGTVHVERLVRSLLVEDLDELIEARLLLKEIRCRWFGSFLFQSEMHAFMPAVLLRMAWFDAFDANAEPQPPHGELAQVEQRVSRSETVSANEALPLVGECENSARFFLSGASCSLLHKPLAREAPKITLHSLTVAVVPKRCEILDTDDAELADFHKRVDF